MSKEDLSRTVGSFETFIEILEILLDSHEFLVVHGFLVDGSTVVGNVKASNTDRVVRVRLVDIEKVIDDDGVAGVEAFDVKDVEE